MSWVFLVCGAGALFLTFAFGVAHSDSKHDGNRQGADGCAIGGVLCALFAAVFLFSAGIAWVAP